MPDVVGQQRDEAVAAVQAAGFDAKVTEVFADKPDGIVVETDPAAGTAAEEGSVVELKVSKGGKPVTVPDVVGTTSSEATKTLQDAGFKVNLVPVPSDQPAGTVVAQNPKPGGTAKQGTIVRLNVAKSRDRHDARTTTTATTAPPPTGRPRRREPCRMSWARSLRTARESFADEGPEGRRALRAVERGRRAGSSRSPGLPARS